MELSGSSRMPAPFRERRERNGGFPEPPGGERVRVVRSLHPGCGAETRIRLPRVLPPAAVRRVVCDRCERAYLCGGTVLSEPRIRLPSWIPRPTVPDPGSRAWWTAAAPLAAVAVIGGLLLVRAVDGGDARAPSVASSTPRAGAEGVGSGSARFVTQPGYSLALPPAWERSKPKGGAAFAAVTSDGDADATLWIERAPDLGFAEFEARSLAQLRSLAGTAQVVERIPAPTVAGTIVRLRAAPEGAKDAATYEVTLRAAGPYRYYLATTVRPGAAVEAREGASLIHGSFVPEQVRTAERAGVDEGIAPGGDGP